MAIPRDEDPKVGNYEDKVSMFFNWDRKNFLKTCNGKNWMVGSYVKDIERLVTLQKVIHLKIDNL
ncbi:hypothetical protein HPP92_013137 [Vanilla planifolia]|uniref:Uncharacterized protein n=1 Tax=Vanilla planifolia TaxID=51239 RepID=A0A835UYI2_VANPL|nr:hypothetical protein HPP92_013137 [Vanilla planifolia]